MNIKTKVILVLLYRLLGPFQGEVSFNQISNWSSAISCSLGIEFILGHHINGFKIDMASIPQTTNASRMCKYKGCSIFLSFKSPMMVNSYMIKVLHECSMVVIKIAC